MSEPKETPDLSSLEKDYRIIGQVGAAGDTRAYSATRLNVDAKRRDDQTGVIISVVGKPAGDEGNALSHLAADTKTLAALKHRRLLPVIEGRWLGDTAFAVVTERTGDESLAEKIAKHETFTNPRVAAILREVNGLLEWARMQHIVHRAITPDRVYLEPNTDRVRVSFSVSPITRLQQADAESQDARTVVRLAMAMLTGNTNADALESCNLVDIRPDLPVLLCEATTQLLDEKNPHTSDEVGSYLAMIGMADPLYEGESYRDKIRAEILEEQRVEREKLANERAEFEKLMADDRAKFAKDMAEKRAAHTKALLERRERLAKQRAEMQRALEAERAALLAKREELEKADAARRAEIERIAAEDRQRTEALRAELKHRGELEIERKRELALDEVTDAESTLDDPELVAPLFVSPDFIPLEALTFEDDNALMGGELVEVPEIREQEVEEIAADIHAKSTPKKKRRWLIPVGVAVLVGALGATAIVIGNQHSTPAPAVATKPVVAAPVAQAVVTPPPSAVPLPSPATVDSAAGAVAVADSTPVAPKPKPKPKPKKVAVDSTSQGGAAVGDILPGFRADSTRARRDSTVKPRRDSVAKPDSNPTGLLRQ